jgi:ParB/RepB/Spo0J family partition protein
MTAAIPATATGQHQWIPLAQLTPSPLNHRKHFDAAKMEELTNNVRVQGVIVPIIARPVGTGFEIVAGERRYRAAKAAELETIPAIVRELSDAEALELQVIENNQRVDVHPLEEAEGYEALMACARPGGAPYTVDEVAAKVGKSKAYVYGRLKLLALTEAGRRAFYEEKIPASTALLVARIPVKALQEKCLAEILDNESWDGGMSFREAKEHVERRYMLRLKEAPFKIADESLAPKAGACTSCPKRTGNAPELFADIASADVCTDPDCFESKVKAHTKALIEKAKASGKPVISGSAAKKIWRWEHSEPSGYVQLDSRCFDDPKGRNWRQVLGKEAAAEHTLLERPSKPGTFVQVVAAEVAIRIARENGIKPKFLQQSDEGPLANTMAERAKEQQAAEIEREARYRTFIGWRAAIAKDGPGAEDLRAMIRELADDGGPDDDRVLKLWGFTEELLDSGYSREDLEAAIHRAEPAQLLPMLLDCIFRPQAYGREPAWLELAKARGVDPKAIEREVKAEFKAKAKAAKKAKDEPSDGPEA